MLKCNVPREPFPDHSLKQHLFSLPLHPLWTSHHCSMDCFVYLLSVFHTRLYKSRIFVLFALVSSAPQRVTRTSRCLIKMCWKKEIILSTFYVPGHVPDARGTWVNKTSIFIKHMNAWINKWMNIAVILRDSVIRRLFFFLLLISKPKSYCKPEEGVI